MSEIVIVGAGIAGMTAAIKASDMGAHVKLISPDYSERSQSVMAMGGINAAIKSNDSTKEHFMDTMNGGCWINNAKAVSKITSNAPKVVKWLSDMGTSFTRDEKGNIDVRYFGGQKKKRTAYAGARTGKQIVTTLINQCRKKEAEGSVIRFIGWRFLSLMLNDGKCCGVICINEDTSEIREFASDSVIIASGGLNKLFGKTSGSIQNDGVTTARLFMQGVELANLEMIQYHPTTVKTPVKRMLITEAARGEGGNLYTIREGKPWYFMKEWYPEKAELMPRDVVSRSIFKASNAGENQVYLDISHLDENLIKTKLDEVYEICTTYLDLDPVSEAIPVYPGVHFFMGGIKTDENHKTNIEGLYAAGECSCQYHGANRLGGNSLLGAVHGGWIAAENASSHNASCRLHEEIKSYANQEKSSSNCSETEEKLAQIMNSSMGIYRNEKDLKTALERLDELDIDIGDSYYDHIKLESLILLAKACILSALKRKESRGAHQRIEYPQSSEDYEKTTCATYDGEIHVNFE
jgi:succinate dehydrogenase / fumarate reductase flavoprotein subunit